MQQFKSIYFPDFPATKTRAKSLKLALGKRDEDLWRHVEPLSSEDLRSRLGDSFLGLRAEAEDAGLSLNALCIRRLRETFAYGDDPQLSFPTILPDGLSVDPIQATFRGGFKEPFQSWYPYLEGYSPDFVKAVLERYASNATHVLDPFAGTGTTPLTSARLGLTASYCELNPLLRLLIEAKVDALSRSSKKRAALATTLTAVADNLPSLIKRRKRDQNLAKSYEAVFGKSKFFDEDTFEMCLRARTWLDDLTKSDRTSGRLASIAFVAALIPSSNLIRRGDVRFRKGATEWATKQSFLTEASKGLHRIALDLLSQESPIKIKPYLVIDDAKLLESAESVKADVIVTSPPYLNGTNYYRNTKVELWFIRSIQKAADLADLRRRTVTAGINDVSARTGYIHANSSVNKLVEQLNENCYDDRIPQMASHYFEDMWKVLNGLGKQVAPTATLLMDIGDSAYGGVHVDTPKILAEMMEQAGWMDVKEVPLRQRMSRSGLKLRQVLLTGQRKPGRVKKIIARDIQRNAWRPAWKKFKNALPHQEGEYAKRNWGNPLHSLCSYQGKMKPALAKHLVEAFVPQGGRMLDVFTGVGTIPFEAASIGAMTFGFDISPAAIPVATAKLSHIDARSCKAIIKQLESFIQTSKLSRADKASHQEIRFNGPIAGYFHPVTFREILLAKRFFAENPPLQPHAALVFACLLHVLHGNRPYALSRRSHPITPFAPTGDFEYKNLIEKLTEKVSRSLSIERDTRFVYGETMHQDATGNWPQHIERLDAIITSPPFFDSTRFYLANWMRLWMAGWSASDFKSRPSSFVDEMQKKTMDVYTPILLQAKERLRDGGVCVFHLGESKKCDMAAAIAKLAKPIFATSEIFSENVEHCESHGIRDKGTVTSHTYLVLS